MSGTKSKMHLGDIPWLAVSNAITRKWKSKKKYKHDRKYNLDAVDDITHNPNRAVLKILTATRKKYLMISVCQTLYSVCEHPETTVWRASLYAYCLEDKICFKVLSCLTRIQSNSKRITLVHIEI